ncbi:MAG: dihydroorotate dehydrogenase [Desulfobacteraceae bacterium]|nr:dihydroorotate dehydrogenase [Desulfobacteraceae bacterium]MCF8096096.1 dihydroorotate dehydrogenase [Desulfobacteraceae bacterium]
MTQTSSGELAVEIGGIHLKNPVMTASGTFGYGLEFAELVDLNSLGGIVVKGLSLKPAAGNSPPRIVETASGMLNAIGLENIGIDSFIRDKLPGLGAYDTPVFVNIYAETVEKYAELASRIDTVEQIAGIEVNISCPNVRAGGVVFGVDPEAAGRVVEAVRQRTEKPVMVKLSPNVSDIAGMAQRVEEAGADAVSLINTITAMAVDINTRRPRLGNITGGLSGPAIKPVALRMVWQAACAVRIPVVGIGGIMTTEDVLEFMIAGATAVQIGTANFVNPRVSMEIIDGLARYVKENNIGNIRDIVGTLKT